MGIHSGEKGKNRVSIPAEAPGRFPNRFSIAAFLLLAEALGTGVILLVVLEALPSSLAMASMLSASIAGVIMTAIEEGRTGLRRLLGRLLIWRAGLVYWLFALAFIPAAILVGSLSNPLFKGEQLSFGAADQAFPILAMYILFFAGAGLGQELGWTGYLLPRLQSRCSALASSLIRTAFVAAWHLPLFLLSLQEHPQLADLPYGNWISQKGFLVAYGAAALMLMFPWSVFFTWVFNNTRGSLLLVAILHTSEIWVAFWMTKAGIDPTRLDNYWGYGALMLLTAILLVVIEGPENLSRRHARITHQPAGGRLADP
jgi:membrane protease YdiL (CAAX protease family)